MMIYITNVKEFLIRPNHNDVLTKNSSFSVEFSPTMKRNEYEIIVSYTKAELQGNSYVPLEISNSAAQQPRQTKQLGHIEHL